MADGISKEHQHGYDEYMVYALNESHNVIDGCVTRLKI